MFNSRVWTYDETQCLLQYVGSKKKIDEIAKLQKRTVASVESKLKAIAANMYFNEHLCYDEIEAKTGIKKENLIIKRTRMELSGSPKDTSEDIAVHVAVPVAVPVTTPERMVIPIQIISSENPFTLEAISTLLNSSVSECLPTPT